MGVDLGEFATAEEAMVTVDESIATRGLEAELERDGVEVPEDAKPDVPDGDDA